MRPAELDTQGGPSPECFPRPPCFKHHRAAGSEEGVETAMCCQSYRPILANLVMESLHPELRNLIGPRLKGKMQQRQKNWMLISDAVYKLVLQQTHAQYEATAQICDSILEALMEPTSRGFSEVRDVFFRELVDMSKNALNDGGTEKLAEHMEKVSMLAFHPVKMQSCYEKVDQMDLEGLQQRFNVSSSAIFVQRAQILMRGVSMAITGRWHGNHVPAQGQPQADGGPVAS
ncbi:hypothetical protein JZ751_025944 [Albula glossodonta]|uniref:Niban 1/2/3 domain-containing protein n=1 Tax=Albula glossodonta TaxID=121402 RepID=A0A8T2MSU7_9TELE|nr:hypothetical protein JZ751_025944 [Albula glossodonta]